VSRLGQLGKDSVIYGLGGMLAKSLSFFLLPVYTRIFTPADYGTIEMLAVLSSFLSQILVMGMDSAQSMYFFAERENGQPAQARVVSAILQWRMIWGTAIVVLATLTTPFLNAAFFSGQLGWEYFAVAFVGTLLAQVMSQSAEVFRLLYRPWSYIGVTLAQSILAAALVLMFILVFDQGILGFFLGAGVASAAMALVGWYQLREYITFGAPPREWWPRLLRFGVPLVPAGVAMYLMSTADRWFVRFYHGDEALGLYAVAAKFALLLAVGTETFRKAWWPIAMDSMHSGDGPHTFRTIARLYLGVVCAGIVALTFTSPWLVEWLTAPAFRDAWPIVGVLAWQGLLYGFFLIASVGIWKTEKTYLNLYLMGGAAVAGLALNQLLVPTWGGMGAAVATAVTYFGWVSASLVVSERLWRVGFPIKLCCSQVGVAAIYVGWFVLSGGAQHEVLLGLTASAVIGVLLFSSMDLSQWSALVRRLRRS
jgi:O-antigen/teichoic acid export membrane protein